MNYSLALKRFLFPIISSTVGKKINFIFIETNYQNILVWENGNRFQKRSIEETWTNRLRRIITKHVLIILSFWDTSSLVCSQPDKVKAKHLQKFTDINYHCWLKKKNAPKWRVNLFLSWKPLAGTVNSNIAIGWTDSSVLTLEFSERFVCILWALLMAKWLLTELWEILNLQTDQASIWGSN